MSSRRRTIAVAVIAALLVWGAGLAAALHLFRLLDVREPGRGGRPQARAASPGDPSAAIATDGTTPAEAAALARLAGRGLAAATNEDGEPSPERDDLEALYGEYHPYFVRGDLNGDGRLDFAQAFVRKRDGGTRFDVAVFFGREDGTFSEPVFVVRGVPLAPGDISVDRSILVVTTDLATDETRRYRWDARSGKFADVDLEADQPVDDAPDPTPDQRPRARV